MRNDRIGEAAESASDRIDEVASRSPRLEGAPPRISGGEERILRIFPYFVITVLIIWAAGVAYLGDYTISKMIEVLCLSFTLCFAILGVPLSQMMPHGAFSGWILLGMAIFLTIILWGFSPFTGTFYFAEAIADILGTVGVYLPPLANDIVGFLGTLAIVLFTSIGVTSVISAYLRKYIPSVLMSMNQHARDGVRGKSETFFMVPDIIDVEEVVLELPEKNHAFDVRAAFSITVYLFVMGLLVSSYLFVNPYFLEVMSWKTMLAITLMLSMFTPALILPWQIFRSIGAKVKSEAHRDYYLWQGAKSRLFTTFAALGAFMMMFLLSVYLGNDVGAIINNYLSFLVPLLVTSVMYGTLYVSFFEVRDREIIDERFQKVQGNRAPRLESV
ncbi:MAG: hypothetical protein Q4Q58_02250 [Thermoplasmata archaeon]|nr:hypothetical protein [Thermoplasmata archaeon]